MPTYKEVLEDGIQLLETAAIEEARLDAWLLLEFKTGKNRAYYFAHRMMNWMLMRPQNVILR